MSIAGVATIAILVARVVMTDDSPSQGESARSRALIADHGAASVPAAAVTVSAPADEDPNAVSVDAAKKPAMPAISVEKPFEQTVVAASVDGAPSCGRYPDRKALSYRSGIVPPKTKGGRETVLREWLIKPSDDDSSYVHHVEEEYARDEKGEEVLVASREYVANQIVVRVDGETSIDAFERQLASVGGSVHSTLMTLEKGARLVSVRVPKIDFESAQRLLDATSAISACSDQSLDFVGSIDTTTPNDSYYSTQWGLPKISAPSAWDIQRNATAITVAVLDTGVRYDHTDLSANMWTNPQQGTFSGVTGDRYGMRCVNGVKSGDPMDDNGHGSHCAGIIGAVANNSRGVAGVCWNAKIMALKAASSSGALINSDVITCLDYARAKGARVVSCSFGGTGCRSSAYESAFAAMRSSGIIVVCAAGNGGSDGVGDNNDSLPFYPSSFSFDNIIAVAATSSSDTLTSFSNYGVSSVDIAAPGYNINSTVNSSTSSYGYMSGTSMAAPFVSGAATLVWAKFPSASYSEIISRLLNNGDSVSALSGKIRTGKRLNVLRALQSATSLAPSPTASRGTYSDRTVVSWSAVAGASYYKVARATSSTGTKTELTGWISSTSYTDTSGSAGTGYYYFVKAAQSSSGSNASEWSTAVYGYRASTQTYPDSWDPGDNSMSGATRLTLATSTQTHGTHGLNANDAYDYFRVDLAAGVRCVFESTGNYDIYAELFNSSGTQIAYNDDGGDSNNFKLDYTATSAGTYYLRVCTYSTHIGSTPSGTHTYSLRYTGYNLYPDQWDPADDSASGGTTLTPGTSISTTPTHGLNGSDAYDFYRVSMTAGETYVFESTSSYDMYSELFNSTSANASSRVAYNDDGGEGTNFKLVYTPTASGTYYLRVCTYTTHAGVQDTRSVTYAVKHYKLPDRWDPADDTASGATELTPSTTTQTTPTHGLGEMDLYDFYRIEMRAGVTYTFESNSSYDMYGELYNSTSTNSSYRVAYDDDGRSVGNNFLLTYTPTQDGTYYLRVRRFRVGSSATYTLSYRRSSTASGHDLNFYRPSGWSGSLIVTSDPDGMSSESSFYRGDVVYVRYSFTDDNDNDISSTFYNSLGLFTSGGSSLYSASHASSGLAGGCFRTVTSSAITLNQSGTLTVRVELNGPTRYVTETSYGNNVQTRSITVSSSRRKTLSRVSVSGADNVTSGGTAQYTCSAVYSDNSTSSSVPATWSVVAGSAFGSISSSGLFTARDVTTRTNVTIRASYTYYGTTRTADKPISVCPRLRDEFGTPIVYPVPQSTLIASVTLDGEPAAEGDVVVAYCGNELRGRAEIMNGGISFLRFYVVESGEQITFKAWDHLTGDIFDCSTPYVGGIGDREGSEQDPYEIECFSSDPFGVVPQIPNAPMTIYGRVMLENEPASRGDMVAVFCGNELRGKASVRMVGGESRVVISAQVRQTGEQLTFKVWDASEETLANAAGTVSSRVGGTVGSNASPHPIRVLPDVTQSVSLPVPGWQFVSVNVVAEDAAPETVFEAVTQFVDRVTCGSEVYSPDFDSPYNTLTTIDPGKAYWVKMKVGSPATAAFSLTGAPADCELETIELKRGWNSVGYVPQHPGALTTVLRNLLNTSKLEEIQGDSQMYLADSPTFSTLRTMRPGIGYWVKVTDDVSFTYVEPPTTAMALASAFIDSLPPNCPWQADNLDREACAPTTVKGFVRIFGAVAEYGDAVVAAFANGSTRPCAVLEVNTLGGVALGVNKTQGTRLTFKVWDARTERIYDSSTVATIPETGGLVNTDIEVTGSVPTYTVRFVLDGVDGGTGTRVGGGELVQQVRRGGSVQAPQVSAGEGYAFITWDMPLENIKCDTTIHACYGPSQDYQVYYDFAGGQPGDSHPAKMSAGKWAWIAAPTRSGYRFLGWSVTSGLNVHGACYATANVGQTPLTSAGQIFGGDAVGVSVLNLSAGDAVALTARWVRNGCYALTYDFNGGEASASGEPLEVVNGEWAWLPAPTRAGYVFTGWKVVSGLNPSGAVWFGEGHDAEPIVSADQVFGADCEGISIFGLSASSLATLQAQWLPVGYYAINYELGGGTLAGAPSDAPTGNWAWIPAPTRAGCRFLGWRVKSGLNVNGAYFFTTGAVAPISSPDDVFGGDAQGASVYALAAGVFVTLEAQWVAEGCYRIDYDLGGGTVYGAPTSAYCGEWTWIPAPVRDGYIFLGWKVSQGLDTTTAYFQSANVWNEPVGSPDRSLGWGCEGISVYGLSSTGRAKLTAEWVPMWNYRMEYDLNGGHHAGAAPEAAQCGVWTWIDAPVRDGYVFLGWTVSEGLDPATAYVQSPAWPVESLLSADQVFGYYGCQGVAVCSLSTTGRARLSAQWLPQWHYRVECDLNGGTSSAPTMYDVTCGEWAWVQNPTRAGHVFVGWKVVSGLDPSTAHYMTATEGVVKLDSVETMFGEGCEGVSIYSLSSGGIVKMVAQWVPQWSYLVRCNANGGSLTGFASAEIVCGEWTWLPAPVRDGYAFVGGKATRGLDVRYAACMDAIVGYTALLSADQLFGAGAEGVSICSLSTGGLVELTAQWVPQWSYLVKCNANGGSLTGFSSAEIVCGEWTWLPAPVRDGYAFLGWKVTRGLDARYAKYMTETEYGDVLSPEQLIGSNPTGVSFCSLAAGGLVELTAQWIPQWHYLLQCDFNGGTSSGFQSAEIVCGEWAWVPAPVREGYWFAGWKVVSGLDPSIAYYATANEGVVPLASADQYFGSGAEGVSIYSLSMGGLVRMIAQWVPQWSYVITCDLDGGTTTGWTSLEAVCGEWVWLPSPTKTGFAFAGWQVVRGLNSEGGAYYQSDTDGMRALTSVQQVIGAGCTGVSLYSLSVVGCAQLKANWTPLVGLGSTRTTSVCSRGGSDAKRTVPIAISGILPDGLTAYDLLVDPADAAGCCNGYGRILWEDNGYDGDVVVTSTESGLVVYLEDGTSLEIPGRTLP